MTTRTLGRRVLAGAGALSLALTGGLAGLMGLAGTAQAATRTTPVFVKCVAPAPQPGADGSQNYTVTLPDGARAGDTVPLTIDPGETPVVPMFTIDTVNTMRAKLLVGGVAQTVTSPPLPSHQEANKKVDPPAFSGTITIPDGTEGTTVQVTVDQVVTDADLGGTVFTTTCTPAPRPSAPVGSVAVAAAPKDPATTGVTPGSGGAGTAVVATGVNFPPGAVTCSALLAGAATGDTGSGTADASGAASCGLTVTRKADRIRIDGSAGAGRSFVYVEERAGVRNPVEVEVLPGALALGPEGGQPAVSFGTVTIDGKARSVFGAFHAATVQDFRGSSLGWDVTATRTPFLNAATGHALAKAQLGIQPSCAVTNPDSPSTCAAGAPGAITDAPLKIASQAVGGGELTGGEFAVGGAAVLQLPPFMFADTYQSVVTFSVA
ncbi:hypothetical protein [Streptomyces sp. NPDC051567]|uniref:hypothetical protein n=1 Tax=Streptomyces sp. NPDC051567 TaxID=3365660 RepID=UPI00379FD04B